MFFKFNFLVQEIWETAQFHHLYHQYQHRGVDITMLIIQVQIRRRLEEESLQS